MPKSRHKGRGRRFTNFEAEQERLEKEAKQANWRARKGEMDSDESEEGSGSEEEKSESEEETSEEESEEEEEKVKKPKGIQGLIQCENPNRAGAKANRKVTDLDVDGKPQLSRREREEIQKQRAQAYHHAGKSEQARADLERLAIIKARREEAEQKRKEQLAAKEEASKAGAASSASSTAKGAKKKS